MKSKKTYMKPCTATVQVDAERLLTTSIVVDSNTEVDAGDSFVRPQFSRPLAPYKGHVFSEGE